MLAPNEARKREGLSPVAGGDQVFMQRQNTPVDLLGELAAADLKVDETTPAAAPAPSVTEEDEPTADDVSELMHESFASRLRERAAR